MYAGMIVMSSQPISSLLIASRETNLDTKKKVLRTMKMIHEAYRGCKASIPVFVEASSVSRADSIAMNLLSQEGEMLCAHV